MAHFQNPDYRRAIRRQFQLSTRNYRVDRAPRCYVTITARCIWTDTQFCMPQQNMQFTLKISSANKLNIISRPTRWPKFVHSCTTQSNLGNGINTNQNIATGSLISHTRHYDYNIYCCQYRIPIRPAIQLIRFLTVKFNRLLLTLWWSLLLQYSAGKNVEFTHQQKHFFLFLKNTLKFTLKYT